MAGPADTRPFFARLADDVRHLRGAPRELWLVFAVKFLESVAYFASSTSRSPRTGATGTGPPAP
jgi:hypothetical protein